MIYKYYAIFEEEKDDTGYNVTFLDIFGGVTCGDNFDDALDMAKDLLKLMLVQAKEQCFEPSNKEDLEAKFPGKNLVEIVVEI